MTRETTVPRWEVEHERFGTPTMVVPASAYDAMLAERDALKEELAKREFEAVEDAWEIFVSHEKMSALVECAWDALAALENGTAIDAQKLCDATEDCDGIVSRSEYLSIIRPLTTSATESREAKGGTT